jgi:hypothetical protein
MQDGNRTSRMKRRKHIWTTILRDRRLRRKHGQTDMKDTILRDEERQQDDDKADVQVMLIFAGE